MVLKDTPILCCSSNLMDTDHNRGDDDDHQRCSMHMLLASTTRAVEFGFHLVAEDDGRGDDEEGREQQGCGIWSEYQPATTQEYLQIEEAVVSKFCSVGGKSYEVCRAGNLSKERRRKEN